MALQALFTDLTGNPDDARFRLAPMPDVKESGNLIYPEVPPLETGYIDFYAFGPTLEVAQGQIEDLVLSTSGTPVDGLPGKRNISTVAVGIGTVDPANQGLVMALAGVYGKHSYTDNTTYDVHRFSREEVADDGGGTTVKAFALRENNQMVTPMRATGLHFTGYTMSAAPNGPYQIAFSGEAQRFDLFGDATQTTGSGSTKPRWIGTWTHNLAPQATDKDIFIKFTVDNSDGTYSVQCKVSSAASYSNTQTLTLGEWLELEDESGEPIGPFRDPVRVFWPSGSTLVTGDTFELERRHDGWVSSLPTRRPISSVNTRCFIGGEEVPISDVNITSAWDGVVANSEVSGSQGKEIIVGGALVTSISITRRVRDLLIQRGIFDGDHVSFVLDAKTDTEIGSTGRYYRFLRVMPRCLLTGPMYSAQAGGGNYTESPVLMAKNPTTTFSYDGYNFDAHDTVLLENEVAEITGLVAA